MSLSDKMLASGNAVHIEAIHSEPILILNGPDAGKAFIAVRENRKDMVVNSDLSTDARAARMLRFRDIPIMPIITPQTRIKTEDGKIWTAVHRPEDGYQSTDYELTEIVPGKDT